MSLWGKSNSQVGNTSSNTQLKSLTGTATLYVGQPVTGNNVPAGTTIAALPNSTVVTLSASASATSNGTYTFWYPPKWHSVVSTSSKTANALFQNTVPASATNNQITGIYPVNATSVASHHQFTNPGWFLVKSGTGPALNVQASNGGINWGNLGVGLLSGGQVNTTFLLTTNATGGITSIALGANGGGQSFNSNTVTVTTPGNSIYQANISAAGVGYVTGDVVTASNNAAGVVNATFTVTANTKGAITALTLTSGGRTFSGTAGDVAVAISSTQNSISNATISVAGTGFTNGDIVTFTNAALSATAATFSITTDGSGVITAAALVTCGKGFDGNASHVATAYTNSTGGTTAGTGATVIPNHFNGATGTIVANSTSFASGNTQTVFTVNLGGRAGRVHRECLVAMHSMTGASGTLP